MPDGDRVHKGLGWKYQKAYKQICDGQFGGVELANEIASAVWKDIQKGGDQLTHFLKSVAEQYQQILDRCMFESINWQQELVQVNKLAQSIYTNQRMKTLAVEACKEQLLDLRFGANPSSCYLELLAKYTWNVYVAQFAERVPLTPSHYKDISRDFVAEQIKMLRPFMKERLLEYVKKLYDLGTVYFERKPRQRAGTRQKYDINTDISTIGA